MSILAGNTLAESPEALETQRAKEAQEEELDEKYSNPDVLQDEMSKVNESLYGAAFVAPEEGVANIQTVSLNDGDINNDELQEQSEIQRVVQEGIHSPYIDNMRDSGLIDASQALDIKEFLVQGDNIQDIDTIPNLSSDIAEQVEDFLHYTNTEEATEQASLQFGEDFGNQFTDFQNASGDFISERALTAYDSIAAHYFPIGKKSDSIDDKARNQALDTAIKTTYNMEIDRKQFKRSVEFIQLSNVVNDSDASLTDRFEAFMSLRDIVDTDQGAKGGRRLKDTQVAKKRELLKNAGLEEVYKQQQIALQEARENGDKSLIQKAQMAIEETQDKARELSEGDIGSFDTTMEVGGVESHEAIKEVV